MRPRRGRSLPWAEKSDKIDRCKLACSPQIDASLPEMLAVSAKQTLTRRR